MISTIILTKNEERDLPKCLNSLKWCDDVHVLDSGSTDDTVAIAISFGAKVSVNDFTSFAQQRNYAIDNLELKYDWILFLDADEVATEEFRTEVLQKTGKNDPSIAGYYCCWKMILEDRWLKRCDSFPKWQFRLLKIGRAKFRDFGHGQKESELDGEAEYIRSPYLHYGFSKGWAAWISRHNKYSDLEAKTRVSSTAKLSDVFNRNGSVRNPALKLYLTRIPGWPIIRFLHAYLFKLGFMEGIPGLIYCVNIAYYEFLIKIKMRENRLRHATKDADAA